MKEVSRTTWDNFIKCKRCFYLQKKLGIAPIGQPGHPINSRVDSLLKEEFNFYRRKQEPHPIFKKYNLNFVPLNDPKLEDYRKNRIGVRAKSTKTNFVIFGALDDLWLNKDNNEVVVLDYKATSNKKEINYTNSKMSYHKSYLRQLDFYAYLLKLNKYKVFKKAYWLVCNAAHTDQKFFEGKVNFSIDILSHDLKTDYIEDILVELEKCYKSETIPALNLYCDACRWHKETSNLKL